MTEEQKVVYRTYTVVLVGRDESVYDTLRFPKGPVAGTFPAFIIPKGQSQKMREDTNMPMAGELPTPDCGEWEWLQIAVVDSCPQDFDLFLDSACVGFSLNVWHSPPQYCASLKNLERGAALKITNNKRWFDPERAFVLRFPTVTVKSCQTINCFISIWPPVTFERPFTVRLDLGPSILVPECSRML